LEQETTMIPMPKEPAIWPHASRMRLTSPLARARANNALEASASAAPDSIDHASLRMLRTAGLARGMRVMAAGSAVGALAAMAREVVGQSGRVIAVDAASLEAPRAPDTPVDALVGRGPWPCAADAAARLRELARHVRTGGIVSWHAFADECDPSRSAMTFDGTGQWVGGMADDLPAALALTRVFFAAGLALPRLTVSRCNDGSGRACALVHAWTRA
jgi:hypothetical protein